MAGNAGSDWLQATDWPTVHVPATQVEPWNQNVPDAYPEEEMLPPRRSNLPDTHHWPDEWSMPLVGL